VRNFTLRWLREKSAHLNVFLGPELQESTEDCLRIVRRTFKQYGTYLARWGAIVCTAERRLHVPFAVSPQMLPQNALESWHKETYQHWMKCGRQNKDDTGH
jgi:hypothetical protein